MMPNKTGTFSIMILSTSCQHNTYQVFIPLGMCDTVYLLANVVSIEVACFAKI